MPNPRTLLAFAHDVVAAVAAWLIAFWLRFNLDVPPLYHKLMLESLLWVVLCPPRDTVTAIRTRTALTNVGRRDRSSTHAIAIDASTERPKTTTRPKRLGARSIENVGMMR